MATSKTDYIHIPRKFGAKDNLTPKGYPTKDFKAFNQDSIDHKSRDTYQGPAIQAARSYISSMKNDLFGDLGPKGVAIVTQPVQEKKLTDIPIVFATEYGNPFNAVKEREFINKFESCVAGLTLEYKFLDSFVEKAKAKNYNIIDYRPLVKEVILKKDNHVIWLTKGYEQFAISVYYNGEIEEVKKEIASLVLENRDMDKYCLITSLSHNGMEVVSKDFYIPATGEGVLMELYPTIDADLLAKEYKRSRESILILYGEPGVGKTTFLKYLLKEFKHEEIYYTKDAKCCKSADFWNHLSKEMNSGILILDDLDLSLATRTNEDDSLFLSSLLSFSDGLLNEETTKKIVITNNRKLEEIDAAVTRPGRCFDFIELTALKNEQAREIWLNTLKGNEKDFNNTFSDKKEVTQSELMRAYKELTTTKISRKYRKIETYDATLDQLKKRTKVGF